MEYPKRHYSYFIVKPDGIRFLNDICQTIEGKFPRVRYYAIEDFSGTIKKLYHKHYERKGEKFGESFEAFLYGINELFGNESILILVADEKKPYQQLMQTVFETKQELRSKYVNNKVGIITDYGQKRDRFVRVLTQNGQQKKPRIMVGPGNYRISDMNIIHSPDPDLESTLDELKILLSSHVIDDKNLITEDMLNQMRKYRTLSFQEDMKAPNYPGEVIPNLSGFIKEEIYKEASDLGDKRNQDDEVQL